MRNKITEDAFKITLQRDEKKYEKRYCFKKCEN